MKLSEGKVKFGYVILDIESCGEKTLLESMGFVKDSCVFIEAKSLLNKTLLLHIFNSTVAIKKSILNKINVRVISL